MTSRSDDFYSDYQNTKKLNNIIDIIADQYENYKHIMMSTNLEKNFYIYQLNDKSPKMQEQSL